MAENLIEMPPQHLIDSHDMNPFTNDQDEIPTVNYPLLFSNDFDQQTKALQNLATACEDYGFFYLINSVSEDVVARALKGLSDFFDQTTQEERGEYSAQNSLDRIKWVHTSHAGENRESLKLVAHPQYYCPTEPPHFREFLGEYLKNFREVELKLAKAISKSLGLEETYIEKALKLDVGFDVAAINLYPPFSQSKGSIGLSDHTDPSLFVSLIQNVNGGLNLLATNGKWISANIPQNAILVIIGDHLEILTNGKYKSPVHVVVVENNKTNRISMGTLHGPALEAFVAPAPELVNQSHPPAYQGMTYKESLEFNGYDEIDVQSCLAQLRLATV